MCKIPGITEESNGLFIIETLKLAALNLNEAAYLNTIKKTPKIRFE